MPNFKFKRPRLKFLKRGDDQVKLGLEKRSGDLVKILVSLTLWLVIIVFTIRIFDNGLPKMPKIPRIPINFTYKASPTPAALTTAQPSASPQLLAGQELASPLPSPTLASPAKSDSQGPSEVRRSCIVCANASPSPSPSPSP